MTSGIKQPAMEFTCQQCGTVCRLPANKVKAYPYRPARKYCSRKCTSEARHGKGPGWVDQGYLYRTVRGKSKAQHRLVMETMIGRSLKSHETVHHRDGNKLNNHPSNLELWSSRHCKGQRVEEKIAFWRDCLSEYGINVPQVSASDYLAGISGLV